ncbi:MAG: cobalamin-dependent protein [Clostridia bacterium]|nr:cobalamin-dependent protein [Clostridia bacterium]
MSGYSTAKKNYDKKLDLTKLKPYGDTLNDGRVQLSFTLPVKNCEKSTEAAKALAAKMGLKETVVASVKPLDDDFTFYVLYGSVDAGIDYTAIDAPSAVSKAMSMKETDECIKRDIGRKIVVVGASTGTDAHTVGIDAIMNMKGYAGHYGLERYEMIEAHNMGAQVANIDMIRYALEKKADVLLVSQTVTQKDIHIQNLTQLVEMAEAEGIREDVLLICGGARISHRLAKELGYDAGFGSGKFADDVATYIVKEMAKRKSARRRSK